MCFLSSAPIVRYQRPRILRLTPRHFGARMRPGVRGLGLLGLGFACRRRGGFLAELAQDAACDEDVALPLRVLGEKRDLVSVRAGRYLLVAVLEAPPQVGQLPLLPLLEPLVVRLVLEAQGQYALGDQVAPVDAGEALGDHGSDPEVQRGESGVLPARALPVVVPPHDRSGERRV